MVHASLVWTIDVKHGCYTKHAISAKFTATG